MIEAAVVEEKQLITKQFLRNYSLLLEEIEGEQERLAMLTYKMIGSSSGLGDGMPRSSSPDPDRMGLQWSIKESLEQKLVVLNQMEKEKREKIEEELQDKVEEPQERRIIRLRYIDGLEWIEIQKIMFGRRKDYYENEEKYKRLVFRIHGNALAKLNPHREVKNECSAAVV